MVEPRQPCLRQSLQKSVDVGLATLGIERVSENPSQLEQFSKHYVKRSAELLKAAGFEPT